MTIRGTDGNDEIKEFDLRRTVKTERPRNIRNINVEVTC